MKEKQDTDSGKKKETRKKNPFINIEEFNDKKKSVPAKNGTDAVDKELLKKFDKNRKRKIKVAHPAPIFIPAAEIKETKPEEDGEPEAEKPARPKKPLLTPARIISLGMVLIVFIGAFLLALPISSKSREWMSFSDAIFTSCSTVCVTGLIVVDTAAYFSIFGQIVIMILMQIGGLGFMTAATLLFFIIKKRITLKNRLAMQEALNQETTGGTVRLMKYVIILTFVIEGIGAVLLMPFFIIRYGAIGIFDSFFASISAFCNAGIENVGISDVPFTGITNYSGNVFIMLTISMLTILGGLGFAVLGDIFKMKRYSKFSTHTKLVLITSGGLLLISLIFFMFAEYNNAGTIGGQNFGNKLASAFLHSASARTSGFTAFEQSKMTPASQLFTIILMFIGASPASTGGGIKTTTLAILFLMVIAGLKSSDEVTFRKKTITRRAGFRAVSVMLFALSIIVVTAVLLMITERGAGYSMADYLFEAVSAFSTTGLSVGITANLSAAGRVIMMVAMFLGRVGPLTIGLMFLRRAGATYIKYPDANIMIG